MTQAKGSHGTFYAIIANLIWGVAALYWIETEPVPASDLVAHRVIWSLPVILVFLWLMGDGRLSLALSRFRERRTLLIMGASASLSALNWGIFMWAVTHGQAAEASLGYFLLPLINVVIGMTVFRESIDRAQQIGVGLAVLAMVLQFIFHPGLPVVALSLALSFALYGAIRKGVNVESSEGLLVEMALLAPFALGWLLLSGGGGLGDYGMKVDMFLLGSGLMTALPLIAYVAASRLLPLTMLGLVFYIGPSVQLLVALFVLGEPFDMVQMIAFALVWVGLAVVTTHNMKVARAQRRYVTGGAR
ncbi:MAG: EamA family transporter RarD [Pseudomonadota bacterium]